MSHCRPVHDVLAMDCDAGDVAAAVAPHSAGVGVGHTKGVENDALTGIGNAVTCQYHQHLRSFHNRMIIDSISSLRFPVAPT